MPLFALLQDDSPLGDASLFDVSLDLGLSPEEHISLTGLAKSRRTTKDLMKAYEAAYTTRMEEVQRARENDAVAQKEQTVQLAAKPIEQGEPSPEEDEDPSPSPGQMTLF
jgi:hypothetical protein